MKTRLRQKAAGRAIALLSAAVVWVAIAGCSDSTGPGARVKIVPVNKTVAVQTNPAGFSSIQIPITITNTSAQLIAYNTCGTFLEQNTSDGWRMVYAQICALATDAAVDAGGMPPRLMEPTLAPGESASFTLVVPVRVQPLGPGDNSIRGDPGEYRLRVLITTELFGTVVVLPHDASVSESFDIVQ
jgi:hypothetical protein